MLAVIDEATPFVGSGIAYGVVSAVLLGDEAKARAELVQVIPAGRRLRVLQDLGVPGKLTYSWEHKTNQLLWIADAIGGAVHEHLTGLREDWYNEVLVQTGPPCLPA